MTAAGAGSIALKIVWRLFVLLFTLILIGACTAAHRLSWDCYAPRESLIHQEWIFIDDIKVQITK